MPTAVILVYLVWEGECRRLLDRRVIWGGLTLIAMAAPWYALVTLETRGAWIKAFIGRENVNRFLTPMENHRGPAFYHLFGILVLFVPWSVFLGPTVWNATREARERKDEAKGERSTSRFLLSWVLVYLVFFSVAATKLPNYLLPVYPALAILTARFLVRWVKREIALPRWLGGVLIGSTALVGVAVGLGLAVAGGALALPGVKVHPLPGLGPWALLGLVPAAAAVAGALLLRRGQTGRFVAVFAAAAVAFIGLLAAFPATAVDEAKAPRQLVEQAGVRDMSRDLRLVALGWFQPSVVFYARREVEKLERLEQAEDCLAMRHPVYLFVPEPVWKQARQDRPALTAYRTVARSFDFYKNCDVLVVTNEMQ
jgi:4-amino-4-deoxy-L-arabinose transferase-like glycosyltransferase